MFKSHTPMAWHYFITTDHGGSYKDISTELSSIN